MKKKQAGFRNDDSLEVVGLAAGSDFFRAASVPRSPRPQGFSHSPRSVQAPQHTGRAAQLPCLL